MLKNVRAIPPLNGNFTASCPKVNACSESNRTKFNIVDAIIEAFHQCGYKGISRRSLMKSL